jgi:hypothetical protein
MAGLVRAATGVGDRYRPMTTRRILVLPGGLPEALAWAAEARLDGDEPIGASLVRNDPAATEYGEWLYLPSVLAPDFADAFVAAVRRHRIDAVFTSHVVVWHSLARMLPELPVRPRLLGAAPAARVQAAMDALARRVNAATVVPEDPGRAPLSRLQRMAVLRGATAIPGQSRDDKLWMLAEAARTAPEGDVVEIGSLWGRSAFMLGWLARHYRLGAVLCVDPWSKSEVVQTEASDIVNQAGAEIDFDRVRDHFLVNMLTTFESGFNAFVGTSEAAYRWYADPALEALRTPWFGTTAYRRQIALLHIDGNHDYQAIRRDLATWAAHLEPGGWVVVDDYTWTLGDQGPRRAADDFVAANWARIARAVVRDGVLYLRLNGGS